MRAIYFILLFFGKTVYVDLIAKGRMDKGQQLLLRKFLPLNEKIGYNHDMSAIEMKIIDFFKENKEIVALYLFGSYGKGVATEQSDVDIAVLFKRGLVPQKLSLFQMKENLSEFLQKDVDLICLNDASPIIGMQVFRYGRCLIGDDDKQLSLYLMHLFTDYCDLKTMRRSMEDNILNRKFYD